MWDTLAEMAEEEGRTTNALIALFHDEIMAQRGEVPNFASFLRVTCMRYMRRRLIASERAQDEPLPASATTTTTVRPFQPALQTATPARSA
jgi:predicted DNA-binding ribbon-helix-helix protein